MTQRDGSVVESRRKGFAEKGKRRCGEPERRCHGGWGRWGDGTKRGLNQGCWGGRGGVTSLSWIVEKGGIRWGKERKDLLGVRSLFSRCSWRRRRWRWRPTVCPHPAASTGHAREGDSVPRAAIPRVPARFGQRGSTRSGRGGQRGEPQPQPWLVGGFG